MAEEIFSEDFKAKRKKYKEMSLVLDDLNDSIVQEYFKCVSSDYTEKLKAAVSLGRTEKHKQQFESFYANLQTGKLCDEDFTNLEIIIEVYGSEIPSKEELMEFYKNVPKSYILSLGEAIDKHGAEQHKEDFRIFYKHYEADTLTNQVIQNFKKLNGIYSMYMPENNQK